MAVPNTAYKLWLGLCLLGKSCGFPKASFYQERLVLKHATAHIQTRYLSYKQDGVVDKNNKRKWILENGKRKATKN